MIKTIDEYGLPNGTADVYRNPEASHKTEMTSSRLNEKAPKSSTDRFFTVLSDTKAWKALLYCLLSLVTGVLYFTWVITGISISASLLILIIGIPFAMAFFFSFYGLAFFKGRIIEALLGERMPRRKRFFKPDISWNEKIRRMLQGKDSWKIVAYQLIMLPLGIIYFTLAVTLFTTSLGLIASPFIKLVFNILAIDIDVIWRLPGWTLPFAAFLGVLLLKGTLHLIRRIGVFQGKYAKSMLVSNTPRKAED